MLLNIREWARGWLAWVLIAGLVAVFALWGVSSQQSGNNTNITIAKVNGEKITARDVQLAYERLASQQRAFQAANKISAPIDTPLLRNKALQNLISEKVLVQAVVKNGFNVSNEQLNKMLTSMPEFQQQGKFSNALFEQAASRLYFTPEMLRASIVDYILVDQLRAGVVDSAFVLSNEGKRLYQLMEQSRSFSYLLLPMEKFVADTKISDSRILDYYEQHKGEYTTEEQVSLEYLELAAHDFIDQAKVSDEAIQQYYEEHIDSYTTPQLRRVAHILLALPENASEQEIAQANDKLLAIAQRYRAGEKFADLAKDNSDDFSTANRGGDLGWYEHKDMFPALAPAAFSLANKNDISGVVRSKFGLHLIKLTDVTAGKQQSLADVKLSIVNLLKQQRISHLYIQALEEAAAIAYENSDSLEAVADRFDLDLATTPLFAKDDVGSGILADPKVKTIAFSRSLLDGNNSDVIEMDDKSAIIVRVHQHNQATAKPLTAVREVIVKQLSSEDASKIARSKGEDILAELQQDHSKAQSIAKKHDLSWKEVKELSRKNTSDVDPYLRNEVFRMPYSSLTAKEPVVAGFSLPDGNYAIVALKEVKDGNLNAGKNEEIQSFNKNITELLGIQDYQLYLQSLNSQAKIKTYLDRL